MFCHVLREIILNSHPIFPLKHDLIDSAGTLPNIVYERTEQPKKLVLRRKGKDRLYFVFCQSFLMLQ